MDKLKDWDKFEIGSVLFPFKKGVDGRKEIVLLQIVWLIGV